MKTIEKIPFSEKLKRWRGNMPRKEAASILGVPVSTYDAWERSARAPMHTCCGCLEMRMMLAGLPVPHSPAPLLTR